MGLKDVLRGKRRPAATRPSGEPWRPTRKAGEDTVELASIKEIGDGPAGADPGEGDEGGAMARSGRPTGRG